MRGLMCGLLALALVACTGRAVEMGEWPAVAYKRTEIERVHYAGHFIVVEQVPRFLAVASGGKSRLNSDSSFDQYMFWDWCRGGGMEWQMVVVRPDAKARSGWRYTNTVVTPGRDGYSGNTRVTEGSLGGQIATYASLKQAALTFFKPVKRACNRSTADWEGGA